MRIESKSKVSLNQTAKKYKHRRTKNKHNRLSVFQNRCVVVNEVAMLSSILLLHT